MTLSTWSGACHCGAVRFAFQAPSLRAFACNCSLCHQRGAIWMGCADARFQLIEGDSRLSTYTFGTHTATHYFCHCCGAAPFSHPRLAPTEWVINLRCVDSVDLATLEVHRFDGQHWEDAARAWRQAQAAGSALP
ncbi:GFA family protein [Stenotrophomonas sp. Marseille-Q5258]|uniref:GFA family protein n=1 Tax=Stenotrophomonas sp. Marseille-Q5258 TaxID=2972779 RepID=UPI0021C900D2|nr:GFA family protein [Stenotrophomonas sp. Marseille-Q5258]